MLSYPQNQFEGFLVFFFSLEKTRNKYKSVVKITCMGNKKIFFQEIGKEN